MRFAVAIALVAGLVHFVFVLTFLLLAFRIPALYEDLPGPRPSLIVQNWPLLVFSLFTLIDVVFLLFLKHRVEQRRNLPYGGVVAVFLAMAPFVIIYIIGFYASLGISHTLGDSRRQDPLAFVYSGLTLMSTSSIPSAKFSTAPAHPQALTFVSIPAVRNSRSPSVTCFTSVTVNS